MTSAVGGPNSIDYDLNFIWVHENPQQPGTHGVFADDSIAKADLSSFL